MTVTKQLDWQWYPSSTPAPTGVHWSVNYQITSGTVIGDFSITIDAYSGLLTMTYDDDQTNLSGTYTVGVASTDPVLNSTQTCEFSIRKQRTDVDQLIAVCDPAYLNHTWYEIIANTWPNWYDNMLYYLKCYTHYDKGGGAPYNRHQYVLNVFKGGENNMFIETGVGLNTSTKSSSDDQSVLGLSHNGNHDILMWSDPEKPAQLHYRPFASTDCYEAYFIRIEVWKRARL